MGTIPTSVICPICSNKMTEMKSMPDQDISPSTLSFKVGNERKHAMTVIYLCSKCANIQSFMKWEEA